jgi:hypothetical protein
MFSRISPINFVLRATPNLLLVGICLVLSTGCNNASVENLTDYSGGLPDTTARAAKAVTDWPAEEAPPIAADLLAKLTPVDGFDFPVAPPNAEHYFNIWERTGMAQAAAIPTLGTLYSRRQMGSCFSPNM